MSDIRPFHAYRPVADKVFHVVTRSADGFSAAHVRKLIFSNPYSFLNVIFPDINSKNKTRPGSPERMKKIRAAFTEFVSRKIFIKDEKPSYYIYRQIQPLYTFTGIVGIIHSSEYQKGKIKVHEHTLLEREQKLMQYLDHVGWNAEPVLFFHDTRFSLQEIIYNFTLQNIPVYDFSTTDGNRHILWKVDHPEMVSRIYHEMKELPAVYIADGHHRTSSSVLLANKRREQGEDEFAPSQFFMGIFFDKSELKVFEFNRLISNDCIPETDVFFEKISHNFNVKSISSPSMPPDNKKEFYVYIRNKWFSISLKENVSYDKNSTAAGLFNTFILMPVFGIEDARTDKRVQYIPGIYGTNGIMEAVDGDKFRYGFVLSPSSTQEIMQVADRGEVMPPKSTWIEPKLLNGLLIYDFNR